MNDAPSQSKSVRPAWRLLPRNVWAVTVTSFLTDISSEMLLGILPFFLANVLGARTSAIGVIEGVAETTASLLKLFSGWLSDRFKARKWPAVLGYAISTISKPFFLAANSWGAVMGIRIADRVGKGVRTAPRDALVADSIGPEHRGLAFGLHRAGDTAGAMLGTLAAALILWRSGEGAALARETFQQVVWWSVLPAVLAVLVLALGSREVPLKAKDAPRLTLAGFDKRFRWFLATVVLFTLGNSSDAFLMLRAQERGVGLVQILLMVASFNLIYALISGPAGAISDRVGRRRIIQIGWGVYALIYLGFALVESAWQVWVLYALYGVYYGMVEGTAKALVADLVPPEKRGTAYGVYNAAVGLAVFPASVIAGVLWEGAGRWSGFGPTAPFFFGAALALAAAVMLRWVLQGPSPVRP
ncbi:MAG: MFS transporter [Anaerolineae bacterium]|nr:MFS transporter [Anaerolineae bacterium]